MTLLLNCSPPHDSISQTYSQRAVQPIRSNTPSDKLLLSNCASKFEFQQWIYVQFQVPFRPCLCSLLLSCLASVRPPTGGKQRLESGGKPGPTPVRKCRGTSFRRP